LNPALQIIAIAYSSGHRPKAIFAQFYKVSVPRRSAASATNIATFAEIYT